MPEIPEMETYKNYLLQTVLNKEIATVKVQRPRSLNVAPEIFADNLAKKRINNVARRAKYLIFDLGGGIYLLNHLMLDGRIYFQPGSEAGPDNVYPIGLPGKPHVEIILDDKSVLYFCDLRLGYLHLVDSQVMQGIIAELGVEPLEPEYDWGFFEQLMQKRRGMIKPLLMNQKVFAGIGNAYSNEILFAAKVLPDRPVSSLQEEELQGLYQSIPRILRESLQRGGYIEEPFSTWDKLSGGAIALFKVYDRANQPCFVCGTNIVVKEVAGRNAFFCPVCQN